MQKKDHIYQIYILLQFSELELMFDSVLMQKSMTYWK
jgi:hypothetical protein